MELVLSDDGARMIVAPLPEDDRPTKPRRPDR
jgi:hypothetical protein